MAGKAMQYISQLAKLTKLKLLTYEVNSQVLLIVEGVETVK